MAKKTGKRLTEEQKQKRRQQRNTERAYKRQRERIEKTITVETNMGGIVPPNILPPTPKKITEASVRRLKRITNISIIEKTYYNVNRDYGEVVKGIKGRKEILKPVILPPNLYDHNPQLKSTKERFDEYKKQADKRLNYDLRKSTINFEELDRKLDEQERAEEALKKEAEDEEKLIQKRVEQSDLMDRLDAEQKKRIESWREDEEIRLKAEDSYNEAEIQKEIDQMNDNILKDELSDILEDEDREFQGRTREEIDAEYERERIEREEEEYNERLRKADEILDDSDWDWKLEESDDERIRRRFEEALRKQDAEAEKEKIKEQQDEEYIEKLKRLHDEEMKKRREDAEKYSDKPADETDEVLDNIEDMIRKWEPKDGWSEDLARKKEAQMASMREILEDAIRRRGRDEVAKSLQEHASAVMDIADDIAWGYSTNRTNFYDALNRSSGNLVTFWNIVNDELNFYEREELGEEMEEEETEDYDEDNWVII